MRSARGDGAAAAAGARSRERSESAADGDMSDGTQYCNSCSKEVLDGCIGCDRCEKWVHGTEMCAGLPKKSLMLYLTMMVKVLATSASNVVLPELRSWKDPRPTPEKPSCWNHCTDFSADAGPLHRCC